MVKTKELCLIITFSSFLQLIFLNDPVYCQRGRDDNDNNGGGQGGQAGVIRRHPAWKQTYLVKYNTTTTSVTNECGKYYASTFLANFFKLQDRFSDSNLCGRRIDVNVYVVARVVLSWGQVQLNTYLNTSSRHSEWNNAKVHIDKCANFVEDQLRDLDALSGTSWLENTELHTIPGKDNCPEATLDGEGFTLLVEEWVCSEGYYLTIQPPPERCHYNGSSGGGGTVVTTSGVSTASTPAVSSTTAPPTECTNAESCVETLKEQLKQTTFCPVMKSLSVCIEMYAQSDAEKAVCYSIFDDLRLEHESATGTSCDDTTTTSDQRSTTSSQKNHETTTTAAATTTTETTQPMTTSATEYMEMHHLNVSDFWKLHVNVSDFANNEDNLQPRPGSNQALTSSYLTIEEGGDDSFIQIRVNASAACAGIPNCDIYFYIEFSNREQPPNVAEPVCRAPPKTPIPQIVVAEHQWANGDNLCSVHITPDRVGMDYNIPIRAKLDMKYDGEQLRWANLALVRTIGSIGASSIDERHVELPIYVEDRDQKATCQSINDPHVTTFDGLQYNNYYEGEFLLYRHTSLPYRVDVMYQKCGTDVEASCNCGVAVQSGDDVFVLERCYRVRQQVFDFPGMSDLPTDSTEMTARFYLNNDLTPGTKLYEQDGGMKYFIYLPLGTYIKVQVSGELVNVWIVASPSDRNKTEGLCGVYNSNQSDDLTLRDGTSYQDPDVTKDKRGQPDRWIRDWRVMVNSADSIFRRLEPSPVPYLPEKYCECQEGEQPRCGYGVDISTCDIYQGVDVTQQYVDLAQQSNINSVRRKKRQSDQNNVINVPGDPIKLDETWIPPKSHPWKDPWNEVNAKTWCDDYLYKNYTIGQLCNAFPNVDIQQEIKTCMEDIQITGKKSWAPSAKSALNEQCLEEIQRNNSIPDDVANQIEGAICINSCSGNGECVKGKCICQIGWKSTDCSIPNGQTPYISNIPGYGFCDVQFMDCSNVVVYGKYFVHGSNLTCFLQEWDINDPNESHGRIITEKGIFVNFNAIECPIKKRRSYLVFISNDGQVSTLSNSLPFIPYNSRCMECNTSSSPAFCQLKSGISGCMIDSWCYLAEEESPDDECNVCNPDISDKQWTFSADCSFGKVKLPDWLVAVIAAVAGSIVGILIGFLLYWCCCKRKSFADSDDFDSPVEDNNLTFHPVVPDQPRYHRRPYAHSDRLHDVALRRPEYNSAPFYNDGRGVENGVNDSTYF